MDWVSAPNIVDAPLEPAERRFSLAWAEALADRVEAFLERERGQLPLWFVAAFAGGIAAWFSLPGPDQWRAFGLVALAIACLGAALGPAGRTGRALLLAGIALALGCCWVWLRADLAAAPRLDRPVIASFVATVERVEPRPARGDVRLLLAPQGGQALPPRVRVSMPANQVRQGIAPGAILRIRARLQPPPPMALPGTHDFARDAWFAGIGGVGRALGAPRLLSPGEKGGLDAVRAKLGAHVRERLGGSAGGIATALATGDQAGVAEEDAEAMRRSGLTHLLSVSGLHIAAVVGAAMLIALRLLALSERLALRFNLVIVSAGAGALAGVGYTLLTGMQVPTVRSCIAALLVLAGIALGREAISLRLVAVGALVVLLFWPEALAGASFQLSFAAVTAIIVLHGLKPVRDMLARREEGWPMRFARSLGGLLITGLVVEIALMPFALYHFHRAGLYGVAANMVAIPLTTFVIMPLEAAALLLDPVEIAGPLWAGAGAAIDLLLAIAHRVGESKGAVTMLPTMPAAAFGAMVVGGLWLALWTGRVRLAGLVPLAVGAAAAATASVPDLLVTGDGRHLAVVRDDGVPVLLRDRAGDYVRDLMAESAAFDGEPLALESQRFARCSRDSCVADLVEGGHAWRLLAIRSNHRIDWAALTRACADADIIVADRRLPRGCTPRWLKLDRAALEATGGVTLFLGDSPAIRTVAERVSNHPWASRPRPPVAPAKGGKNAAIRHRT